MLCLCAHYLEWLCSQLGTIKGLVQVVEAAGSLMHWAWRALGIICQTPEMPQPEATLCQGDPATTVVTPNQLHGVGLLHLNLLIEEKLLPKPLGVSAEPHRAGEEERSKGTTFFMPFKLGCCKM